MDWLIPVSVAVIAIAFAVLTYFLVKVLKSAEDTLNHTAETVDNLQTQLDGITKETTVLLHKTNLLAEDIQDKSNALDPTFEAVKEMGDSLKAVNNDLQDTTQTVSNEVSQRSDKISEVVRWSNTAMALWRKWKLNKAETNRLKEELN
ncbi:DUF948 domain-containing protein [Pseudalkalibacillus caeni]|uniref:DUF948 domain-containing protein n=1 Tax=Exobacillus caeni TaxID=2574798 RepID=A0A5R9F5E3_9BACL|nr:DUF948 domain-containing protein [Pseudalkalibacillus caeni]TLS38962.1 DUF948 domain-containing protein [Pseudalkalibacillus caeni]